ncbi:MAG TPA: hypothetical protein VKA84_12035, partial [Gemmatimonadaceae bacterium]|nr:hypothetical protein [Gemmatimonadaceae bacterium]
DQWEISTFNRAFTGLLPPLADGVDPEWRDLADRVAATLRGIPEKSYKAGVPAELQNQLRDGGDVKISLFIIEARIALRELERRLLG